MSWKSQEEKRDVNSKRIVKKEKRERSADKVKEEWWRRGRGAGGAGKGKREVRGRGNWKEP